jgi:hypothetical protein
MMNNFSDENFEVVTGHDGRKVRIVKDGGKVVVGMQFMDSMGAIQRQVASDYVADRPRVRAFDGTNAGLHRPGARFADERHVDPLVLQGNARDRALLYRMYDVEKASEFRGHPGGAYYQGGADEWRGSQPGDERLSRRAAGLFVRSSAPTPRRMMMQHAVVAEVLELSRAIDSRAPTTRLATQRRARSCEPRSTSP